MTDPYVQPLTSTGGASVPHTTSPPALIVAIIAARISGILDTFIYSPLFLKY